MKWNRSWAALATYLATAMTGSVLAASGKTGNTNQPPRNPDPKRLVWIRPGTFTMGSPTNDAGRFPDEGPRTQVTISQGLWMSKHETTQAEYLTVMGSYPSSFTGDMKCPVETVSWPEATNYCGQLTVRERAAGRLPAGYRYRLPTEAEWEYCCRAGTTTRFSYGDDSGYTQLGAYAWYGDKRDSNSKVKPSGVSYDQGGQLYATHAVGGKKPNAWGLYDMHGNVWEWCLDAYGTYPGGRVTDPKGSNTGSHRVVRGGSWINRNGRYCRSALRNSRPPDERDGDLGFRIVLAPGQ